MVGSTAKMVLRVENGCPKPTIDKEVKKVKQILEGHISKTSMYFLLFKLRLFYLTDICNCNCNYEENTTVEKLEKMVEQLSDQIDKSEEQLTQVKSELADISSQVKASSKILPLTTDGLSSDGNPVKIGFIRSTSGTQSFPLPAALPSNARMVRVIAFHRSGNEGPSRQVQYRLWTEVGGEQHLHFLFGTRYPQSAISFQSPEFWFLVDPNIRV
jgi:hypothetical protein